MNNKYTDKTFFNIIEIFGFKSSREFVKTLQNSLWKERRRLKGPWNCILERQHKSVLQLQLNKVITHLAGFLTQC